MPASTATTRWRQHVTLFLTAQTISLFGSMLVQYAVMWHLTLVTKSGAVMAAAAIFGFLPQAIVSVFGGVWADRMNRKWLINGADAVIATSTLILALTMMSGYTELWLIYLTLAIRSAGAGIQTPAVGALIPQITPSDKLMRVNGINGTIQAGMMLLAPAVAGALYAAASITSIFFVDVVTAAISIVLVSLLPVTRIDRGAVGERAGYFDDLVEGVTYTVRHRLVRWLLLVFGAVMLLAAAPSYLTPLMVVRNFGDEVWKLTANELAFSIGMLAGGGIIAAFMAKANRAGLLLLATSVCGVLSIALGLSTNMWVFFAFMLLVGFAVAFFSTPAMTLLQEKVEPERQGRVFGFMGIVMALAMPIGMMVYGPLADVASVESLLLVSGLLLLITAAVALLVPAGKLALVEGRAPAVPEGQEETAGSEQESAATTSAPGTSEPGTSDAESLTAPGGDTAR